MPTALPVFGFAALHQAWQACRRGKQGTRKAQRYGLHLLDNLVQTSVALQTHAWHPSPATRFVTLHPKPREILAADFGDRVVHHLLVPWLERLYEPVFIADSFANRKGKGTHAAVRRLQAFARSQQALASGQGAGHYLQLDIANFFNSIQRRTLFGLLQARVQRDLRRPTSHARHCPPDEAAHMLWLARQLLTGNPALGARYQGRVQDLLRVPAHKQLIHAAPEIGLPIGNLTSQFFANVYLNELDQFIKHQLKVRHYVRYVDDFVLLHHCPQQLAQWRSAITAFLHQRLGLALRDAGRLAPVANGIDFLGYIVRPHYLLVRRRVLGHLHGKLAQIRQHWQRGDGSLHCTAQQADQLHAMLASYWGHIRHAHSHRTRAQVLARHPWLAHWLRQRPDGALQRVDGPAQAPTLARQWRWFARRYPGHALLVQVGSRWECSALAGLPPSTRRPGLPPTHSLHPRDLPALQRRLSAAGQPWLAVAEAGHQHSGRKRRQLCAIGPASALAGTHPLTSTPCTPGAMS
ncbi:RNA-directed DNA polymerase [Diaphorobacter limosus]|uniref:RNA-directed DNA polymerase n=1 Tax=Diaphorobacter limosus TaxID=3036128 RepID=A0ABZ0J0P1_9BURK|nr:RNA-directed DNA polymerase [Diaphorobacter sp. Y-1]WOO31812.1 RNA-directed DNA polymerase [Diaphorobacter sp. Y-1]